MANLFEYLKWRGDVPLAFDGFNGIDSLIFSELVYIDLDEVVPADWDASLTLREAAARYREKADPLEEASFSVYKRKAVTLLQKAAETRRFGGVRLHSFVNQVIDSAEMQMAAVTFETAPGKYYVAYRGTDDSMIGWKEDFNLSYLWETEGQRRASLYLNHLFAARPGVIAVGGHSKGGNFAVYAAASAAPGIRERIVTIYNNDGPGFRDAFIARAGYQAVRDKIVHYIPSGSVIGVLMQNETKRHVVKSDAQGIVQHDGFSWQVLGTDFEPGERTGVSLYFEDTLSRWIEGESDTERRQFVDALFEIFENSLDQIDDLSHKRIQSLWRCFAALRQLPSEKRQPFLNVVLDLLKSGRDVMGEKWLDGIESKIPKLKS
ncbi:MAG: Mbeg1-like protein [Pseudoramibacter sp.]